MSENYQGEEEKYQVRLKDVGNVHKSVLRYNMEMEFYLIIIMKLVWHKSFLLLCGN